MTNRLSGEFETGLSAFQGHGLAQVGETSSTIADVADGLATLGIADAEQLVALASVEGTRPYLAEHLGLSIQDLDTVVNEAEKAVPSRLVSILEAPGETDLEMGALEPTQEMMAEAEAIPIMAVEAEAVALPNSVNWARMMPHYFCSPIEDPIRT
ncbi:hypothetical protein FJZ31_11800 [Candidatus Poribacteria bacterium]|nr:hypothetical protein [Candidatus Poribacteria bacterium]